MPEIVLDNLVKRYGKVKAADGLTLTVKDGEYLCILGPTGSGKTTCLRMICGLTKPDSGSITFDGKDIGRTPISERRTTMLSQVYSLFPTETVYDNVMFSPHIKEWPEEDSKQLAKSMLEMVHMGHKSKSYPIELSGGQQQRTALARALASDSKVLLLDEPLRALDARLRLELRKELKSMTKEMGLTAVHVTHDQDEALEMADRIAIIRNGKIVQVGTPTEVFVYPATPFVANFVGRSNIFVGSVGKTHDGHTDVVLGNGSVIPAREAELPEGTAAVVAVKIGSSKLYHAEDESDSDDEDKETPAPKAEGYISGVVERILYEGATITIELEVEGVGRVTSKLPNRKYDEFKAGDKVSVYWPPEVATIFDMSPEKLEDELRLD